MANIRSLNNDSSVITPQLLLFLYRDEVAVSNMLIRLSIYSRRNHTKFTFRNINNIKTLTAAVQLP
jgi:hypothetical protein